MTLATIERLQSLALKQFKLGVSTPVILTPGELAALCRLARLGMAAEAESAGVTVSLIA